MRAMILAAGRGQRLRPLTDGCPKPLIKINGKALIVYHIEALKAAGVEDIVINVCHLGEQIMQTLGDGSKFGVNLHYSVEALPLETGGGIVNALPLLGTDPFILVNGDIFTDFDFKTLFKEPQGLAHLVLTENPKHKPTGDFSVDGDKVIMRAEDDKTYTYTGMAVLKPELFENCQSKVLPLPPLLYQAILNDALSGEVYKGFWADVGSLDRLKELERDVAQKFKKTAS